MKIKIYPSLWTNFTRCPSVFIIDFEQVNAGWETRGGETKQERSTKISFDIFIETMFAFFLHLLIENFKPKSYCFERNNRIWCLNSYDFELYQTMFHNKTALFVVYKWPLRIETIFIKLNEVKLKCLKFCSLNCHLLREEKVNRWK